MFKCICLVASVVSDSLRPYGPIACQVPLSMGLLRQEYWSGLPFPSPCLKQINNRSNAESLRYFAHTCTHTCTYLCEYRHVLRRRQWHPTPVLLTGKSHGRRSLGGCSPWGCWGSDTTERVHFHFSLSCIGEGKGNPLQCSCLENPRDRGAWWAAVYGVTQSRTRLKWLSSSSSRHILKVKSPHFISLFKCHAKLRMIFILIAYEELYYNINYQSWEQALVFTFFFSQISQRNFF